MSALACFLAHLTAGARNHTSIIAVQTVGVSLCLPNISMLGMLCPGHSCFWSTSQQPASGQYTHPQLQAESNYSCAMVPRVHECQSRLVLAGAPDESRSNADAPMCTALEAAVREGALLWVLPSVTAYAAMSSGCRAACLSEPMLSQLAQIRYAMCVRPAQQQLHSVLHLTDRVPALKSPSSQLHLWA